MKKILLLAVFSLVILSVNAQIKVTSIGYVGINNTSPVYQLDVKGKYFSTSYSSYQPFVLDVFHADPRVTSGNRIVFYNTAASGFIDIQCKTLYEYSDATAKENITPLATEKAGESGSTIEKIKKLNGVNYNWKDDGSGKLQAGFLAQEVEAVIPEAVFTNDSTQNKSLAYSALIPYLVEAIKEQQAEIDALKQQLGK